ncbi:MAG: LysR family transcriptional regulator [Bacteroidetes bacterium]|nr:LysR family transcriptional regulator [Bacteroidota bacterium]
MNYTLHQLAVYLKVSELKSITRASEELHLTQPAVSIQLKNFQDQFDVPLTEVVGRRLYITDFGKEIAIAARNILDEVHAINYRSQAFRGKLSGRLKLSIVSTGKYIMPSFLSGFMKQYEEAELQMDVTNKAKVIISLEENEVDFSLVSVLPENLKVEKLELLRNKLFLVGEGGHPFHRKTYDKSILDNIPLIFREPGSGTRHTMEKFLERNRLQVKKKMELTSNEAVKQAVIEGLGYSIMPLIGIKNELKNGDLKIIPVKGLPIQSVWNLIWLKGKKLSPVADRFLTYLRREKQHIIRDKFNWSENY